jgi:hypothetical protein
MQCNVEFVHYRTEENNGTFSIWPVEGRFWCMLNSSEQSGL